MKERPTDKQINKLNWMVTLQNNLIAGIDLSQSTEINELQSSDQRQHSVKEIQIKRGNLSGIAKPPKVLLIWF